MTTTYDEDGNCSKCGQRHERNGRPTCTAHRSNGDPCKKYPITGHHVCATHGGRAAQVQAAAATNRANDQMAKVLSYALRDVDERHRSRTPDEQLLEEVARSAQAVEWLASRVAELYVPDPNDHGPMRDVIGVDEDGDEVRVPVSNRLIGPDHNGDLGIHPFWKKLDEERDRHARMCKLAIDAGISERLVRIAEAQGQRLVAVIVAVIDGMGLDAAGRERARRLAAEKMRELSAAPLAAVEA